MRVFNAKPRARRHQTGGIQVRLYLIYHDGGRFCTQQQVILLTDLCLLGTELTSTDEAAVALGPSQMHETPRPESIPSSQMRDSQSELSRSDIVLAACNRISSNESCSECDGRHGRL